MHRILTAPAQGNLSAKPAQHAFRRQFVVLLCFVLLSAACSSDASQDTATEQAVVEAATAPIVGADPTAAPPSTTEPDAVDAPQETVAPEESAVAEGAPQAVSSTFTAEVWADNWFGLHVNGALIGEDSVPITTERSFNAETITFEATYPLTIAIEAKDFKQTDSGIEYIGLGNQQMGDGGLIAQMTDNASGEVVAVTSGEWAALVIHRAPLNTECERDADPDATCQFEITETPLNWTDVSFDDSAWTSATIWTANDVGPKDGYDQISWSDAASLIWGSDLEVDNTVLLRLTVSE